MADGVPQRSAPRVSVGLVCSAAASWIAPIAVVVHRLGASDLPRTVPTQWSLDARAGSWVPLSQAFWFALIPSLIGAFLITVIVVANGDDVSRLRGALGLAGGALVTSGIGFTWFASVAVAEHAAGSGAALLTAVVRGLFIAAVVFAGAAVPRHRARAGGGG